MTNHIVKALTATWRSLSYDVTGKKYSVLINDRHCIIWQVCVSYWSPTWQGYQRSRKLTKKSTEHILLRLSCTHFEHGRNQSLWFLDVEPFSFLPTPPPWRNLTGGNQYLTLCPSLNQTHLWVSFWRASHLSSIVKIPFSVTDSENWPFTKPLSQTATSQSYVSPPWLLLLCQTTFHSEPCSCTSRNWQQWTIWLLSLISLNNWPRNQLIFPVNPIPMLLKTPLFLIHFSFPFSFPSLSIPFIKGGVGDFLQHFLQYCLKTFSHFHCIHWNRKLAKKTKCFGPV